MNKAMTVAEFERLIGPTRDFQSRKDIGCQKCGAGQFVVRWCAGKSHLNPNPQQCPVDGEHLHVICNICQYSWCEKTKEQAEADAAPRIQPA